MSDRREHHVRGEASKLDRAARRPVMLADLREHPPLQDTDVVWRFYVELRGKRAPQLYAVERVLRAELQELRQIGAIEIEAAS